MIKKIKIQKKKKTRKKIKKLKKKPKKLFLSFSSQQLHGNYAEQQNKDFKAPKTKLIFF